MGAKTSKVLFLAIGSQRKAKTGEPEYSRDDRISSHLSLETARSLYEVRRGLYDLIKTQNHPRDGSLPLSKQEYNSDLDLGPDFYHHEKARTCQDYLSAIRRYKGRFYRSLGEKEDPEALIARSTHHLLIISPLYGLLTPKEPIQCYNLHVEEDEGIPRRWKKNDLLTTAIIEYIEKYKIDRIFDVTGDESFRNLANLDKLRNAVELGMLHGFSRQQGGADLLPELGELLRYLLDQTEEYLLRVQAKDNRIHEDYGIVLLSSPNPEPGEVVRQIHLPERLTRNDMINRWREEIFEILRQFRAQTRDDKNFYTYVDSLQPVPPHVKTTIKGLTTIRGFVHHEGKVLYDDEWYKVIDLYATVIDWARREGYTNKIVDRTELRQIKLENDET